MKPRIPPRVAAVHRVLGPRSASLDGRGGLGGGGSGGGGSLWVTVPCKGRLSHLRQTTPHVLSSPLVKYCLVDYSCPEHCGSWFEQTYGDRIRGGTAVVHRVHGKSTFSKCGAHNAGASVCLSRGADYVCFLDADTLVLPGFFEFVVSHMGPNRFLLAGLRPDGSDQPSLTGVLVVPARVFAASRGFDESFVGWGGEDIEYRLRLFLLHGLDYVDIPLHLMRPIQHGNELRTRYYETRSIGESNARNMSRTRQKVWFEWAGRTLRSPEQAKRLWYHRAPWEPDAGALRPEPSTPRSAPMAAPPPRRRVDFEGVILRKLQRPR